MSEKKNLSELTLEELYVEKRKAENVFPGFMNTKSIVISVSVLLVLVFLALYAMKDDFSYILTFLMLYLVYSFFKKLAFDKEILKEIKSRG